MLKEVGRERNRRLKKALNGRTNLNAKKNRRKVRKSLETKQIWELGYSYTKSRRRSLKEKING